MKRIAHLISILLEPLIVVYLLALFWGIQASLSRDVWLVYIQIITVFVIVAAAVRIFFQRKDKTNWDISNRKQRIVPLTVLLMTLAVVYLGVRELIPGGVSSIFLFFLAWALGYLLITFMIKASGHVGILTLFVGCLVVWFGPSLWITALAIPLLAWSRLVLRRHTLVEVIVGCCYSVGFLIIGKHIGLLPQ